MDLHVLPTLTIASILIWKLEFQRLLFILLWFSKSCIEISLLIFVRQKKI